MKFVLFTVAAACLVLGSFAAKFEKEDGVYIINESNYDEALRTFPPTLYVFSAPWCVYCKQLAPELVKAAEELVELKDVARIAKINCDEEDYLCGLHQISGLPTIKLHTGHVDFVNYEGERKAKNILSFILRQIGAAKPRKFVKANPIDYMIRTRNGMKAL